MKNDEKNQKKKNQKIKIIKAFAKTKPLLPLIFIGLVTPFKDA